MTILDNLKRDGQLGLCIYLVVKCVTVAMSIRKRLYVGMRRDAKGLLCSLSTGHRPSIAVRHRPAICLPKLVNFLK